MKPVISILTKITFLCLLALLAVQAQAQVQVTVVINRLSSGRYPTKLYQFQQYPNVVMVTLTNTTAGAQRVFINGVMSGDNGVMIRTKANYTPGAIELAAFQQKRLNAMEVAQLFDQSALEVVQGGQDVKNNIIRDQALPEGIYQVCVRAFDYATRQPLSPEEPLGCSNSFTIATLEAPVILSPIDQDSIKAFTPQNMILRWSIPPGAPPSTQYTIKIVEAFKSFNQTAGSYFQASANEIIQTTPTPIFETTVTGAGSYLYGPGQPPLVKGRSYALVITARDIQREAQFRNNGQSQAILFKYGITHVDDQEQFAVVNNDTLPKLPTLVKGKLQYRFAGDTSSSLFPVAYERVYLKKVFLKQDSTAAGIQYTPLTPAEQQALPPYQEIVDGVITQTDGAGNFQLQMGMTTLDSAGVITADKWNGVFADNAAYPARKSKTLSPLAGGSLQALKGRLTCLYQVVISNTHYQPYRQYLEITPGGTRNVSNLVLDANSYSLKVNVREVFNGKQGGYAKGCVVKLYRLTNYKKNRTLGIPLYEGDIQDSTRDWKEYGDKVLIAARTTPTNVNESDKAEDNTVVFSRLFRNAGAEPYNYLVLLEKGGVVLSSVSFQQLQAITGNTTKATANTTPQKNAAPQLPNNLLTTTSANKIKAPVAPVVEKSNLSGTPDKLAFNKYLANIPGTHTATGITYTGNQEGKPVASDKWTNWAYNQQAPVATLSLQKELATPPRSRLTGILQYKYKNDNATPVSPYANMKVKLMVMYVFSRQEEKPATSNSNTQSSRNTTGTLHNSVFVNVNKPAFSYQGVANTYASTDQFTTTAAQPGNTLVTMKMDVYKRVSGTSWGDDNGKVLQTAYTDAQGRFTFDFENADSTMQVMNGTWYTGYGDLSQTHQGKLMRVYRVVPDVPYYCSPDDNIPVQPWGDYDCGTLTSYVRTYNLRVHITDNNLKAFENIPVNLYRSERNPYWASLPQRPGEDINQRVALFGTPATGSSNSNTTTGTAATNGNALIFQASLVQRPVYTAAAAAIATGQSYIAVNASYILKRKGLTTNDGIVLFKNLVLSRDPDKDNWLIQADGASGNRTGTLTFETVYLNYPKQSMTREYSDKWYADFNARTPNAGLGPIGGPHPSATENAQSTNQVYDILFNSELNTEAMADAYLLAAKKPPRIAGRVIDEFTSLGIPGITVKVQQEILLDNRVCYNTSYSTGGRCEYPFYATTDANGYYDVKQFSDYYKRFTDADIANPANGKIGINGKLIIQAPGYETVIRNLPANLLWGQQLYEPQIIMKPTGTNCYGYVADADDTTRAVAARVKLKINGRWVDTYSYSGSKYKPAEKSNYLLTEGYYAQMLNNAVTAAATTATAGQTTPATGNAQALQIGSLKMNITPSAPNAPQVNNAVFRTSNSNMAVTAVNTNAATTGNWAPYLNSAAKQSTPASNSVTSIANGTLQNTPGINYLTGNRQRFDIDLPARPDSIIIMPYDPAYLTQTKAVKVSASGQYLGTFALKRRRHKVRVTVMMRSGTTSYAVKGAAVSIDGVPEVKHTSQTLSSAAYFEFVNNATTNFVARAKPAKAGTALFGTPTIFVPESVTFNSKDDNDTTYVTLFVQPGEKITGKVLFAGTGAPVKGATVYLDEGTGSNSELQVQTGHDGSYTLVGVPRAPQIIPGLTTSVSYVIKATYNQPGKTYVGDSRSVGSKKGTPAENAYAGIDLTIKEVADIDISRLYGIPVHINALRRNTDSSTYTIDGEWYNLPANDNFAMRQDIPSAKALPFRSLKVKASALRNAAGVPLAVPAESSVALDCRVLSVKAFEVFNAAVTADVEGNSALRMVKAGSDTAATLQGSVRIVDNSFNFPTSYMTITGKDFFLGNYGQAAGAGKLQVPVFTSGAAAYPLTKFSITNDKAAGITFKYLGFNGITETTGSRESFVMGDSVNLFMNLSTVIKGNIPLQFNSGHAVIRHDRLSRMVSSDSIRFQLEQWTVACSEWQLAPNSGGIQLKKGTLFTSKADLPFTDMVVMPGELDCQSISGASLRNAAAAGKLTLGGGAARLNIYNGTEVAFVYDPDAGTQAGKGHYKLSLRSDAGRVAWFSKLDGMTDASQRFNIQYLSLLSNNEDIFSFDAETPPVNFYTQMQYTAQRLYSYEDRLVLSGLVSLGIAGVPDNINGTFTFYKVNGQAAKTNRLHITPLQFAFTGEGGTRFTSNTTAPNSQQFTRYGIGIAGDITLPDVATALKANLLSMITQGAKDPIATGNAIVAGMGNAVATEVKKQAEIYIGDALNRAKEFADETQDYVKGVVNDARNEMMNQLNEARNTLQQSLPIGTEQTIAEVAAKWRLAGEGMNAIKDFEQNPVGSLLRLNGVFKGFTGMDIKGAVEERAKMVANQALKGLQESLPVEKMSEAASSFKGMKFDFDLKNGRIMGSLSMPSLNFGAVVLKDIGLEMLMDKQGWYFYAGGGFDMPQTVPLHPILLPVSVGMLIGNYPVISPALEARVTQTSYVKKLPKTYKQGVRGFFMTGKKEIISATSVSVKILDVDFEIGASAGLDARLYANFGGQSQQIGLGAMAFGNAYAKMAVLFGACGVKGDVAAELGIKAAVTNESRGVTVDAKACASLKISGRVWCLMFDESYSKSIMALLSICGGANCKKAVDFTIEMDGSSCSTSNDFDY